MNYDLSHHLDRRAFLRGTTALALAGGVAGAGSARAAAAGPAAGGGANLPFPSEPGPFLAAALTAVYGPTGQGDWTAAQVALRHGAARTTSAARGTVAWRIGKGTSQTGKNVIVQFIRVDLHTTAFTGTFTDPAARLRTLALDPAGSPAAGSILCSDPMHVSRRFADVFYNPIKWPKLIFDFQRDPVAFYRAGLTLFFPAEVTFAVPLTATTADGATLSLRAAATPHMLLRNAPPGQFPPNGDRFTLVQPLTGTAGGNTLAIDTMDCTITHRTTK